MNIQIDISGFCFTLFIVFLILKLCNVIAWSWLWVFAPIWIPFSIVVIILIIGLFICGIVNLVEWIRK